MRMTRRIFALLAILACALWVANTSLFSRFPESDGPRLIAHRGVHQTFDRTGLTNDTCTAQRIFAPEHGYLENTIPSMRAAFEAGAEVVELDVHLTPDGRFAVFHDWTLDCRTEAEGVTGETSFERLRVLDVGYGYTADGGLTFPFRGQGVGLMPELEEVFAALPAGRFLVNFKSRREEEGRELARRLNGEPAWRAATFGVYGGDPPTEAAIAAVPDLKGYTRQSVMGCLTGYLLTGWFGRAPEACRDTLVPVPVNYARFLWGWPERFHARMRAAGSDVIITGVFTRGDGGVGGIDSAEDWGAIPAGFPGFVWTNRIEKAGAFARESGYCDADGGARVCALAANPLASAPLR